MSLAVSRRSSVLLSRNEHLHHCASLCQVADTDCKWLVFYNGAECTDEQRVVAQYWDEDGMMQDEVVFDARTGNPVVFYDRVNSKTLVIFSRFTDVDVYGNFVPETQLSPVTRWKYCRNYVGELVYDSDGARLENVEEIPYTYGLLARISPLDLAGRAGWGGTHLIGFYREKDPECRLWVYDPTGDCVGTRFRELSAFCQMTEKLQTSKWVPGSLGEGLGIQPTLTFFNDKLYAFCRNVARVRGDDRRAWMCVTKDGQTWTDPVQSIFPSHNNSLAFVDAGPYKWAVFSTDAQRSNLWLYCLQTGKGFDLRVLRPGRHSFSYPNTFVDSCGTLHVVHTSCRRIAWHTFNLEWLRTAPLPNSPGRQSLFRRLSAAHGDPIDVGGLNKYFKKIRDMEDVF